MRARSLTAASRARRELRHRSRWSISTSTSCPACWTAGSSPRRPGWCGSAAATTSAIPTSGWGTPCGASLSTDGQRARGPDPSAHAAAHVRALLQPGQLLLLLHPPGAARSGRRGGDQHAMGGAARLCVERSGEGAVLVGELREGAARLAVHGYGARYTRARRRPARRCRSTSRATSGGRSCLTRRWRCAARAERRVLARHTARYPFARLRVLALIYGHALG